MSVTEVIGASNKVIFKSGFSVGPSSVVGFSTTWELVWKPLGGVAALRSGVMARSSSWEPNWVQQGGGALISVNMVIGGSPEAVFKSDSMVGPISFKGFSTTWELVWEPSGVEGALVSVNMVPGGSLEVVFKSGLGVGLSSFVGFGTTWELVWVPLGGK